MLKKLICAALICASILTFASCSCSVNIETQPTSAKINEKMQIGEFASYVTKYTWVNEESGDTMSFNDNGTLQGELDGVKISGRFTLKTDSKKLGRLIVGVTLDNSKKSADYTLDFKNTAEMTFTSDKGKSESYKAEWATEKSE